MIKKGSKQLIRAADLFCGAGGTSTGLLKACKELGFATDLLAINHWDIAIATHTLNHEHVKHLCQNLDKVDPLELIPSGRLDLMVASPECTHHSNARGGKPRSDQKRADAWLLMRWLEKLYVKNLLIENVKEFMNWGPLGANGQPLKSKRGQYFQQFIATLKINYNVEYKVLNCANYGDPTTRERFFLLARRHGHAHFAWPVQTHASPAVIKKLKAQPRLFSESTIKLKPWRTARNHVIDWRIESRSIFDRKKPLSPNTMARIFAGLRKHSGLAIVMATGGNEGQMRPRGVDEPVPTVMPNSRLNVVEAKAQPFVIKTSHKGGNGKYVYPVDGPISTVTGQQEQGLVEASIEADPFVMKLGHTKSKNNHSHGVNRPLTTITSLQEHGLVEAQVNPCIINMKGKSKSRSIDEPTVAQTTKPHQYVLEGGIHGMAGETEEIEPVLVNHKGTDGRSRSVDAPAFTQCAGGTTQSLVEGEITPFTVNAGGPTGQGRNSRSVDEPIRTVMAEDHQGLVEGDAFIIHSGGPDVEARSVDEPTRTLLTREHQALVETEMILNIRGGKDGYTRSSSVDEPLPALTTQPPTALVETKMTPFIVTNNHGSDGGRNRTHDVDKPMPAVTTIDAWSVIEPYMIQFFGERDGQEPRTRSVDEPAWTVTGQGRMAVVEPHLMAFHGNHKGRKDGNKRTKSIDEPLPAQDTSNRFGVVEGDAFMLKSYERSDSASLDKPAPTICANFEHLGLVESDVIEGDPNLVKFYGTAKGGQSVDDPLDAVTAKDRFGLVEPRVVRIKGTEGKKDIVGLYIPELGIIVDIRFRMLQPPELAAAMSFPKSYKFSGNRENKVMQIGNAVPCRTAQALCKALLTEPPRAKRAPRATKVVAAKVRKLKKAA